MKKDKIKIGLVGFGHRGIDLLSSVIVLFEDVEVAAVCDLYEDRRKEAEEIVFKNRGVCPLSTPDYHDILSMEDIDAVVFMTSWMNHIGPVIETMKAGKYVACEVGGAYSIDECWQLVHAYEETGVPCMLLENCCYAREELMVLNMVRQGLFGEIVHCQGGYRHELRDEVASGREKRHYRLANYMHRNCENYPTHELGPIARVLNINKGNRMLVLNSVASKSAGLHDYLVSKESAEHELSNYQFAQGDVVTTIIKCAHGETITLTLDTTLPRPYSRGFHIQGTKGIYQEDNRSVFLDENEEHKSCHFDWKKQWNNIEKFYEQYDHPVWKEYAKKGAIGGHGGCDGIVFRKFFDAVKNETQTPIDVYDMAAWMSITPLSEQSIAMGGMPVAIPDFTNGRWITRKADDE